MLEYCKLLLAALRASLLSRRDLALENLLLRHQLMVATRTKKRPRLRSADRFFWAVIARRWSPWRRQLLLVRPETVVRWHRRGWRLYWRWRSGKARGRPPLSPEVRGLIARMGRENPLWGTLRIQGELRKLGIDVSSQSIRKYRGLRRSQLPGQAWRTFLANHAPHIWAADFFTVQTLTFRTLYVLFFVAHKRRRLVHLNVTAHPTVAWVWRQLVEATAWGRQPKHLIRDRDKHYGSEFVAKAGGLGIRSLLTPVRAPRANAIAERLVRTLREECLDHVIVLGERHLARLLHEYAAYYNSERPHRALVLRPPVPETGRKGSGPIMGRPVLGGLHHAYRRAA